MSVSVWVTFEDEELELIRRHARRANLSVSEWIRETVLRHLGETSEPTSESAESNDS